MGAVQEPCGASAQGPECPSERLAQARRALVLAEERAGLRTGGSLEVQRALSRAAAPRDAGRDAGHDAASPAAPGPWGSLVEHSAGAVSISGSTTLLLAAAALHQGPHGWCAVLGGEDLGWCAAAELGLDLSRVLVVPAAALEPSAVLAAASALLDGVGVLLIGRRAARVLSPRSRRLLTVRARERGALILTGSAWEGARALEAAPLGPDGACSEAPSAQDPGAGEHSGPVSRTGGAGRGEGAVEGGGAVVALDPPGPGGRRRPGGGRAPVTGWVPAAQEMAAGYLRALSWSLVEPHRGQRPSILTLGEDGLDHAPSGVPGDASARGPLGAAPGPRILEGAG